MKIILSRKGFDSSNGKQPNPIMPDGTLLSLPIPDKDGNNTFDSLLWDGVSYYDIISSLKPKTKLQPKDYCHLDPDLRKELKDRLPGWMPAFGQAGSALTHLRNHGVTEGDLFLFYGWFKETEVINGKLAYKKGARDLHVIYAYMQIVNLETDEDWLGFEALADVKKVFWNARSPIMNESDYDSINWATTGIGNNTDTVTVSASFNLTLMTPFIAKMINTGSDRDGAIKLHASATEKKE